MAASSWNPTLLVNTEAFQVIDDADSSSDLRLTFGNTINKSLTYERTATRFQFDDDLLVTGDLEIIGTASGRVLHAQDTLTSSGTLIVKNSANIRGTLSGASLVISSLRNCNTIDTNGAGALSCGTDETGAGGGLSYSDAASYFVNDTGDTMTGSLTISNNGSLNVSGAVLTNSNITLNSDNGSANATLTFGSDGTAETLNFLNAADSFEFSDDLAATGNITGSGSLKVDGTITSEADLTLNQDADTNNVTLTFGSDTTNETATWLNAPDRFEFSDDLATTGNLTASGTFKVTGAATLGSTLTIKNVTYTFPASDGSASGKVLKTSGAGQLSWSADSTGAGGGAGLTRIAGASGAAGADITWQNLTADSSTCTTTALCAAIMTTTGVGIGTWKYKYTLIYQSAATTTGIGFGIDHTGTVGQIQHMWWHITTGGAAATGTGDDDTATAGGQLVEGKQESVDNTLIGSATTGVAVANTDIMAILEGIIVVTVSGDLQLKISSEVASSAVKVMADSTLELMKIE